MGGGLGVVLVLELCPLYKCGTRGCAHRANRRLEEKGAGLDDSVVGLDERVLFVQTEGAVDAEELHG